MLFKLTIGLAASLAVLDGQQIATPKQQSGIVMSKLATTVASGGQLISGAPSTFSFPKGNGLGYADGPLGFRIAVPNGSTTLRIDLVTNTPSVDIDLYIRYGEDVGDKDGQPVADYRSEGLTGNETLVITTGSNPPLLPGVYYIAFGVFTPVAARGTITATIGNSPNPPTPLPVVYPWQTDWIAYAAAITTFLQTFEYRGTGSFLTHPKFDGKTVSWQGTVFLNPGPSPGEVGIRMPSVPLKLFNGAAGSLTTLYLIPKSTDVESWNPNKLPSGTQVNFRVKLGSARAGAFGGSLTFLVVSSQVIAFLKSYDGELLGQPPAISQNGVVDGASFRSGISPGSWFSIRGTSLASTTRTWTNSDFNGSKLPKSLDGVSVQVNGKDAFIYFVSPAQINALAPSDTSAGTVAVTLTNSNGTSSSNANLRAFAPAFFTLNPEGGKYLSAVHSDGTLVGRPSLLGSATTTRPVAPGDRILLFGTGFGPTDPAVPTEEIVRGAAPIVDLSGLSIRIGGVPAKIEFAGLTGSGLYQFNVVIPNIFGGDQPVVAEIGGGSTQSGAFLTITGTPQPSIAITPTSLSFRGATGGNRPPVQVFSLFSSAQSVNFTVAAATTTGGNWLAATPLNGATPADVSVSADHSNLSPGTYSGTLRIISIDASNSPLTVGVSLVVGASATITAAPSSLSFQASQGGSAPTQQNVALSSSGAPIDFTLSATTNWVTLDRTSGSTPSTLKIGANIAGLVAGDYSANVLIRAPGASNPAITVTVTLRVAAASPNVPLITNISPASLQPGDYQIINIAGTGLAGGKVTFLPPDGISFDQDAARSGPSSISGFLKLDPTATPGARVVTVTNPFGSGSTTFTIQQRTGVFTISNIRAGPGTLSGTVLSVPITVDFRDASGAASSGGLRTAIVFVLDNYAPIPGVPGPFPSFYVPVTLASVPRGQTTGSIPLNVSIPLGGFGTLPRTGKVTIVFINSNGDTTNALTAAF